MLTVVIAFAQVQKMGTHIGFTHIYEENGKLWKEAPSPNPPLLLSWELSGIEREEGRGEEGEEGVGHSGGTSQLMHRKV